VQYCTLMHLYTDRGTILAHFSKSWNQVVTSLSPFSLTQSWLLETAPFAAKHSDKVKYSI
jgi:hypothetical protein